MTKKTLTENAESAYNEDTNIPGAFAPRRDAVNQQDAEASMRALLQSKSASPGLPVPPKNPEYVSCWVPDDTSLYSDNASVRSMQGWTYATEEDYPNFAAYAVKKDAISSKASGTNSHFRYRECVLMKLPVGAHKAWMEHYHTIRPREQEEQALRDIRRTANPQLGARLEGDDPFAKPEVTKVSTYS